jgi:hypothetical protein
MITGFEKETHELTDYELELVPRFVKGFKTKIGEDNAIKNIDIQKKFKEIDIKLSDARIRKVINYIRVNGLVKNLISSSKGYWIENDQERIDKYINSLQQRINSIQQLKNSFNK